jgi:hypothetical protein
MSFTEDEFLAAIEEQAESSEDEKEPPDYDSNDDVAHPPITTPHPALRNVINWGNLKPPVDYQEEQLKVLNKFTDALRVTAEEKAKTVELKEKRTAVLERIAAALEALSYSPLLGVAFETAKERFEEVAVTQTPKDA